ncbi:hypothetical protein RUND412_006195 [Rhizina undulata]
MFMSFVRGSVAVLGRRCVFGNSSLGVMAAGARGMGHATMHENDPEVLEKGKQDVLKKHLDPNEIPHWHEELASDAEAYVKAVRGEVDICYDDNVLKYHEQADVNVEKHKKQLMK